MMDIIMGKKCRLLLFLYFLCWSSGCSPKERVWHIDYLTHFSIMGEIVEYNEKNPIQNVMIYFQDHTLDNYPKSPKNERLIVKLSGSGPFRDEFSYFWGRKGTGDIETYRKSIVEGEFFIIIRSPGYLEKRIPIKYSKLLEESQDDNLEIDLGKVSLEQSVSDMPSKK